MHHGVELPKWCTMCRMVQNTDKYLLSGAEMPIERYRQTDRPTILLPRAHIVTHLLTFEGHLCTILILFFQRLVSNILGTHTVPPCHFWEAFLCTLEFLKNLHGIVHHSTTKWCTMWQMVHKWPYFLIRWCMDAPEEVQTDRQSDFQELTVIMTGV